ncbi:TetR family transcriptional regulator [Chitinophaga skermanii]|uniref:TetR family transcriptional regulator n=1 Tax=Chitinophaga skermanii TaxID=331697 RepID=A0A327QDX0_9BACT|nr:TetR/AcrR family transcriptional regulator [Chitinophaga skermanii]RAI99836.1 TetR family transcriptional regulator [Chitinophaga skermanii]
MRARDENKILAIREKTMALIVSEGLDGFSMNKLAKAAGISPATLYIYYKDKEDLIVQTCIQASLEMMSESLKGFDPTMSFAEGLALQWFNRAKYFTQHQNEVEFVEKIRYSNLYEKPRQIITQHFRETLGPFVQNAIARKELMPLPFEVYWSIAFAPLYQLIKFHTQTRSYHNEKFELSDDIMKQTLALVLKALKPS